LGKHEKKKRAKKKKLKEKQKKKKKSAEITVLGEKVKFKPPSETLLEGLGKKKR
jgi:hypothetical protein